MNRRGFFKTIVFGAIAAAVAKVLPKRTPVAEFRKMTVKVGKLGEGCRKMRDATGDATAAMQRLRLGWARVSDTGELIPLSCEQVEAMFERRQAV